MKTRMEQLRADIMTKGAFTRRERRLIKYLSPGNEAQRQMVKAALPERHPLRAQMDCCGEVSQSHNLYYCGVPLCPRCHMRERTAQTAKAIKKIFVGASNDDLAFATILLPVQLDFSGMTRLLENEKRRLRTFVDRQRKKDERWAEFELLGWWEIDRMSFCDFEHSGRNTRIALEGLNFPLIETPSKTIWRPHLHAIIRKGELTTEEVASALRKETHTAKYQVDIQPFRDSRSVGTNIQNIVRYCLKFRIETDYKKPDAQDFIEADQEVSVTRNWWSPEDIYAYVTWLCEERSGFQSLRFRIGSTDEKQENEEKVTYTQRDIDRDLSVCEEQYAVVQSDNAHGICVRSVVYNNMLQDTNWTKSESKEFWNQEAFAFNWSSKFAGNVISLKERLHGIAIARRDDASNGSMGRR